MADTKEQSGNIMFPSGPERDHTILEHLPFPSGTDTDEVDHDLSKIIDEL